MQIDLDLFLELFLVYISHCSLLTLGDRRSTQPVKKLGVCLMLVTNWNFARLIAPVVTTTSRSSLTPIKSKLETFWYQLTQIHLVNGR